MRSPWEARVGLDFQLAFGYNGGRWKTIHGDDQTDAAGLTEASQHNRAVRVNLHWGGAGGFRFGDEVEWLLLPSATGKTI
jgi:hypothetical protein